MKLDPLVDGHPLLTKLKLTAAGLATRQRAPDVLRVVLYRPELFGRVYMDYVNRLLRDPSAWTLGERELFAAWVSHVNRCQFCATNHRAVAASVMGREVVDAVFADVDSAPIAESTRATLRMLRALVLDPDRFGPEHVRPALEAGASRAEVEQAMHIANAFCVLNLLAEGLGFEVPSLLAFERLAAQILRHGYRL